MQDAKTAEVEAANGSSKVRESNLSSDYRALAPLIGISTGRKSRILR